MANQELLSKAVNVEQKLQDTLDSVQGQRGITEDVVKIVVPMFKDQLALIKALIEEV